jgi:hypothetical protein
MLLTAELGSSSNKSVTEIMGFPFLVSKGPSPDMAKANFVHVIMKRGGPEGGEQRPPKRQKKKKRGKPPQPVVEKIRSRKESKQIIETYHSLGNELLNLPTHCQCTDWTFCNKSWQRILMVSVHSLNLKFVKMMELKRKLHK